MKITTLIFICDKKFKMRDAEKLRGFFASKNISESYFHNHNEDGSCKYRMPMINYSVKNGNFTIVAYNDLQTSILKEFFNCNELTIANETFKIFEKKIETIQDGLEVTDKMHKYRFKTMWLALNQENYKSYLRNEVDLNKLLRNNILANFSGLGTRAEKEIMVLGNYRRAFTEIKNQKVIGFYGEFYTNVKIPKYFGIGKRKSVGYGEVEKID